MGKPSDAGPNAAIAPARVRRAAVGWDPRFFTRTLLFWPLLHAERFAAFTGWPTVDDYNRTLGDGAPVRFREQPPRRRRRAPVDPAALYDARIHLQGWVPTRPRSWHDFLNMLVWAAFPRAKGQISARQARALQGWAEAGAQALPGRRTREQDGLAMLDEGGLLLLCEAPRSPALGDALEARRPEPVAEAIQAGGAAALIFGHAVYEHLVLGGEAAAPVRAMTHLLPCPGPLPASAEARVALADARLCADLEDPQSFCQPDGFCSLPVDARLLAPG